MKRLITVLAVSVVGIARLHGSTLGSVENFPLLSSERNMTEFDSKGLIKAQHFFDGKNLRLIQFNVLNQFSIEDGGAACGYFAVRNGVSIARAIVNPLTFMVYIDKLNDGASFLRFVGTSSNPKTDRVYLVDLARQQLPSLGSTQEGEEVKKFVDTNGNWLEKGQVEALYEKNMKSDSRKDKVFFRAFSQVAEISKSSSTPGEGGDNKAFFESIKSQSDFLAVFLIGTMQVDVMEYGHWYAVVAHRFNGVTEYFIADSAGFNRLADPGVTAIISELEGQEAQQDYHSFAERQRADDGRALDDKLIGALSEKEWAEAVAALEELDKATRQEKRPEITLQQEDVVKTIAAAAQDLGIPLEVAMESIEVLAEAAKVPKKPMPTVEVGGYPLPQEEEELEQAKQLSGAGVGTGVQFLQIKPKKALVSAYRPVEGPVAQSIIEGAHERERTQLRERSAASVALPQPSAPPAVGAQEPYFVIGHKDLETDVIAIDRKLKELDQSISQLYGIYNQLADRINGDVIKRVNAIGDAINELQEKLREKQPMAQPATSQAKPAAGAGSQPAEQGGGWRRFRPVRVTGQ